MIDVNNTHAAVEGGKQHHQYFVRVLYAIRSFPPRPRTSFGNYVYTLNQPDDQCDGLGIQRIHEWDSNDTMVETGEFLI